MNMNRSSAAQLGREIVRILKLEPVDQAGVDLFERAGIPILKKWRRT